MELIKCRIIIMITINDLTNLKNSSSKDFFVEILYEVLYSVCVCVCVETQTARAHVHVYTYIDVNVSGKKGLCNLSAEVLLKF